MQQDVALECCVLKEPEELPDKFHPCAIEEEEHDTDIEDYEDEEYKTINKEEGWFEGDKLPNIVSKKTVMDNPE